MSPKRIDSKKLVAKIFKESSEPQTSDTETVTAVLANRKREDSSSVSSFAVNSFRYLQNFAVGSLRPELGGIDIGTSSVKFVLLGRERGKLLIKDVQIEKLAKLSAVERREEKEKELQNALVKIASRVKSKTKVGIALNDPSLFAEPLAIQLGSDKDLRAVVQKELSEKHLIDPAASFFDYMATSAPDTLNKTQNLFVVAAPRELVYRQFGIAQSAGFRVLSVETNALATLFALRRVLKGDSSEKVLFLDIGFRYTNLGILFGGRLVFNRIIPIAGERFTRAVERELRCDFEAAEQLKIQHGLKYMERFRPQGAGLEAEGIQVSGALEQEVEALLTEVERSFQFAFKTESGSDAGRFHSIYLLGGGSRLGLLKEYLEKRLESPVRSVDLWQGFTFQERVVDNDFLKEVNDSVSVALGVALRVTEF